MKAIEILKRRPPIFVPNRNWSIYTGIATGTGTKKWRVFYFVKLLVIPSVNHTSVYITKDYMI